MGYKRFGETISEETIKRLGDIMVELARKSNNDENGVFGGKYGRQLLGIEKALVAMYIFFGYEHDDNFKYTCVTIENYRFDV